MSSVKEELHIKTEKDFDSQHVQDSNYQSIFISESTQDTEGDANPKTKAKTVKKETDGPGDQLNLDEGHTSEDQSEGEFDEIEGDAPKAEAEIDLKCKHCKRPFKSKVSLANHHYVTKGKCRNLGINWETMSCTICNKKHDSQEGAIRHPSTAHQIYQERGDRRGTYDCDICGKKIGYKDSLRDHKLRFHNESKSEKFKCNLCKFTSPVRRSLIGHMKHVHDGVTYKYRVKPLKCSLCDHSTPWKSKLLDHIMAVHQKVKDQVCDLCDYATTREKIQLNINWIFNWIFQQST